MPLLGSKARNSVCAVCWGMFSQLSLDSILKSWCNSMTSLLRLAVQKSGRLSDESELLLRECGVRYQSSRGSSRLTTRATDFPLEVLFLRDDDIPGYVADGVADLGIVGFNIVSEREAEVETREFLGFSQCRLALAVPRGSGFRSVLDLGGKRIATTYPRLLHDFLEENKIQASIHTISGSAEIAPAIGLADAVCDLVSSGSTLASNGLEELETVFRSEAVLISTPNLDPEKAALVDQLVFRIQAVNRARKMKYVMMNVPDESLEKVSSILSGTKSPSVVPLAIPGWSAVHVAIAEGEFWECVERLKTVGAEGILVLPIEKMI